MTESYPVKTQSYLLQTYFGDVRDIYQDLIQMPFDGIGLDFIEGRKTIELVEKYGFPNDKVLFAGLVNGKNIWKNNYKKTLETVSGLKMQESMLLSVHLVHFFMYRTHLKMRAGFQKIIQSIFHLQLKNLQNFHS